MNTPIKLKFLVSERHTYEVFASSKEEALENLRNGLYDRYDCIVDQVSVEELATK